MIIRALVTNAALCRAGPFYPRKIASMGVKCGVDLEPRWGNARVGYSIVLSNTMFYVIRAVGDKHQYSSTRPNGKGFPTS